jgi:hypothetical protein
MKILATCLMSVLLAVSAGATAAETLTFEDLTDPGDGPFSVVEGSFTVDYDASGGFSELGAPTACSPVCASNGTNAFYNSGIASYDIHRTDHGTFSLVSLDAAQKFTAEMRSLDLFVIGTHADASTAIAHLTTLPGGADDFSTYLLGAGFRNLVSVRLHGGAEFPADEFSFDNVVTSGAGGVPEPTTWGLMFGGFLGVGSSIRHKRRGRHVRANFHPLYLCPKRPRRAEVAHTDSGKQAPLKWTFRHLHARFSKACSAMTWRHLPALVAFRSGRGELETI